MKYVLFDIDSTLIEAHTPSNKNASQQMFKKVFGIDAHEEQVLFRGRTENSIIKDVVKKFTGKDLKTVPQKAHDVWAKEAKIAILKSPPKIMPGIKNIVSVLSKNKDIRLCVLTGNSPKRAFIKLNSVKLAKYFKDTNNKIRGVFGTEAYDRETLLVLAKKKYLKNKKSEMLIIDDSLKGAQMAKKHKVPAIMVATSDYSQKELSKYSKFTFKDFGDNRWKQAIEIIDTI